MSKSALADGAGTRTLTEPLLLWLDQWGTAIVQQPSTDPIPHSLCKLLVALGDHSTSYFAEHIASPIAVTTLQGTSVGKTRGHLTQMFLKLLLGFTGLDGYYGEDEDESEMTLGFWYLFQEALWGTDYYFDQDGNGVEVDQDGVETWGKDGKEKEKERMDVAKAVYSELVQTLRRKVRIPPAELAARWPKGVFPSILCIGSAELIDVSILDQMDKFQVFVAHPLRRRFGAYFPGPISQLSTGCWRYTTERVRIPVLPASTSLIPLQILCSSLRFACLLRVRPFRATGARDASPMGGTALPD